MEGGKGKEKREQEKSRGWWARKRGKRRQCGETRRKDYEKRWKVEKGKGINGGYVRSVEGKEGRGGARREKVQARERKGIKEGLRGEGSRKRKIVDGG